MIINSFKLFYWSFTSGEWKCQVTSSSYDSDDALSSRPARLVVRIPPEDPQIYYKGRLMNNKVSTLLYIPYTLQAVIIAEYKL